MSGISEWVKSNNRVTAPVLAVLFSVIVALSAIYFYGELMFLVPVVTFVTFHYTGLYRLRLRLLGGTIVFIIVAFLATGLLTNAVYHAHPTYQTYFTNGTSAMGNVTATVTPYSGQSPSYVYHIYITPNGSLDFNTVELNIHQLGGVTINVQYAQMQNTTFPLNNTVELTYTLTNPGAGIYSYNLTAQKNGTIYTPEISGPLNTPFFSVYVYILPTYAIYYLIIFELIFVVGVFIARSFSSSRRYSQQPPHPPKGPPEN